MKLLLWLSVTCFLGLGISSSSSAQEKADFLLESSVSGHYKDDLIRTESFEEKVPDLERLRLASHSPQRYLESLFRTLRSLPANRFREPENYNLILEFVLASQCVPEIISNLDFSGLDDVFIRILGMAAACNENLTLFEHLLQAKVFDLNASYEWSGYKGNAVVFLITNLQALSMARKAGLNLRRPVIAPDGKELTGLEFLERTFSVDNTAESTVCIKRPFEQDSSSDDKRNRTASIEWTVLVNLSPRSDELLTNPDYLRIIRSRLAEEGPESVAALIKTHPHFLEREDFLPMLREVLHDSIIDIAQIYASDLDTTRPILYMIDEQLESTEYYIHFLFELLKSENGIKVTRQFVESLLDNQSFLEAFDFSELQGSILTAIAHLSVRLDFMALVEKIAAMSKKYLEQRVVIDGNSINVYTHVRSAPMLKKLFELRIQVPSFVEFSNRQVPFVYHFMRMPDPAFKDCIRKSRIIPRMKIMESIAYCRQIENDELVSELADLLGLARIKND